MVKINRSPPAALGADSLKASAEIPDWLSSQQHRAVEFVQSGQGNATVIAVAGSGKTTLLVQAAKFMSGRGLFMAFNKKIADEVGFKLQREGVTNVRAATFHSVGLKAWKGVAPRVRVDADKVERLLEKLDTPRHLRGFAKRLCSLAKQHLVLPDQWDELEALVFHHDLEESLSSEYDDPNDLLMRGIEWAQKLLRASMDSQLDIIDFDDMLFAPIIMRARFEPHDWVCVDEAQDTNNARRTIAKELLHPLRGRFIAVGDPRQAIYGFTGADSDAIELIERDFNCTQLPLTITYRCPKAVVRLAQRWVSHIEAADEAPEGIVRTIHQLDFQKLTPETTDAILCRNMKPLVSLALGYIRKRVPAHVEGRDLGQSLLALVKRWKSVRTVLDLGRKLEEYRSEETARLLEKNQHGKLLQLEDRIDSISAICDILELDAPVQSVIDTILSIFKDTEGTNKSSITLSTVHRSKGREWDRVYLYGRNKYMPSPYAKQEWQLVQERNLMYVAVTRAKQELIEVIVEG